MNLIKKFWTKGILVLFVFFLFLIIFFRPVRLTTYSNSKILFCWAWDRGNIEFINSVTGGRVNITFNLKNGFSHFEMNTDEKTEDYYTSGIYNINDILKKENRQKLNFCSIKGMDIKIGAHNIRVKNSCASLEVLWKGIHF